MSDEITWEDPPRERLGRGSKSTNHVQAAAALRGRPGVWAVVAEYDAAATAGQTAYLIRTARTLKAYAPAGAYEAVARTVDKIEDGVRVRHCRVYARFMGA